MYGTTKIELFSFLDECRPEESCYPPQLAMLSLSLVFDWLFRKFLSHFQMLSYHFLLSLNIVLTIKVTCVSDISPLLQSESAKPLV